MSDTRFAERLLGWFDQFGRKSLPWQEDRDPYRVWISEIMLQQTQVTAVIPYYRSFMSRFPNIRALADATADEVMAHWSGLGYYARARNLHHAARQIVDEHDGEFPQSMDEVVALPGIGRSTAGAILAFCFDQRHPILDGNVKRVLARYHGIAGYPGKAAVARRMWQLADEMTPAHRIADYTQAIMDLGATLCTRSRPRCGACPQAQHCQALAEGQPTAYPTPKPKKQRPERRTVMLVLVDSRGRVLLERRPPTGIWGGLWSLPEVSEIGTHEDAAAKFGVQVQGEPVALSPLQHGFTHFILHIEPIAIHVQVDPSGISESADLVWANPAKTDDLGLPKPVATLLSEIALSSDLLANVIT